MACKEGGNGSRSNKVDLKKGLLVYLPFNGSFADSSGNDNPTAAVYGPTLTYDQHGYPDRAFNGTANGEKVCVTNNGSIKFDSTITISVDVMLRAAGTNEFISYMDDSTAKGLTLDMGTGVPGNPNLAYAFADSLMTCDTWSLAEYLSSDTSNFIPQPECWYNFIAVFDRGMMHLYVNGSLISSRHALSTTVPMNSCATLNVGGWWDGDAGSSVNGKLDNFRLYNRVLTPEEIAELSRGFQVR